MNYYQVRKLSMFWLIEQYLKDTSPELLNSIPNFLYLFSEFQLRIEKLDVIMGKQGLQRDGNFVEKSVVKDELCFDGSVIAGKIKAYAINVSNYQLMTEVNYSRSVLMNSADARCVTDCRLIWDKGTEFLNALVLYGITENLLIDYKKKIDLFSSLITKPKQGINSKKEATDEMRVIFKEASELLDKMEVLTNVVEVSDYPFYVGFKIKKRMTSPAYKVLSAIGTVVDGDGAAVELATMTCKELGFERRVSKKGGFRLRNMPDGVYPFVFSRTGYEDTVFEMVFYSGVRFEANVVMRKM